MSSPVVDSVINALCYGLSRRHVLEGRFDSVQGTYRNWDGSHAAQPERFLRLRTEEGVCRAVRESRRIGAVGAGHSFNGLHLDRPVLVSLDRYAGLVRLDRANRLATFRAGTRLRDVARMLHEHGLALPVLPDHNAQSLAGILATDVHASGDPAHVSQSVERLKVIDGRGRVVELSPGDPRFRATIGGMGCTGLIVEATLRCVDAFRLETHAFRCSLDELLEHLDEWCRTYDHLAAGYIPAIDGCIVEVKSRSEKPLTPFGPRIESFQHIAEAIGQALALPLTIRREERPRKLGRAVLDRLSQTLAFRPSLVLDSYEGFNRNVYHVHQEVEFTCSREQGRWVLEQGRALFRRRPFQSYYLLGLRWSRCHEETLIGPAAGPKGRDIVWMAPHLIGNVRNAADDAEWRRIVEAVAGRPHYGKHMLGLGADYLARVHGPSWQAFLELCAEMDPHAKFANALVLGARRSFAMAAQ